MEIENCLAEAIETVENVLDNVTDQFREAAYPVLLNAAIRHKDSVSIVGISSVNCNGDAPKKSIRDMFRRPPNELLARARPKGHTEAVLLISAHLDAKKEVVTARDIRELLNQTKRQPPKNIFDVLTRLVQQGSLSVVDKQGRNTAYAMTELGWESIQGRLEDKSE